MKSWILLFFKGMAMGAADIVPGVSGGTIAFISGVYERLVESLRRINPSLIQKIKKEGIKETFKFINGSFLLVLFSGVFFSIATLSKLITFLLHTQPIMLNSFFLGLILISSVILLKQVTQFSLGSLLLLCLGVFLAYMLTVSGAVVLPQTYPMIFCIGAIAICAMILPGISGSFLLLLLGFYSTILEAINDVNFHVLGVFLSGAVVGILSFSHFLNFLLKKHHDATFLFLIGLMLGSMNKLWPWKQVLSYRINSKGQQVPWIEENISPFHYDVLIGQPPQWEIAIGSFFVGIGIVYFLEKIASLNRFKG